MSHVSIETGSEGPRHDPYHYNEMTVERPNGDTIVIHEGLANWCHVSRDKITVFTVEGEQESREMFQTHVGASLETVIKAYRSLPYRRIKQHACRPRRFFECEGYPGETFLLCRHCNEAVDYSFNRSVVE